jgi:acetyl esterase/lipase
MLKKAMLWMLTTMIVLAGAGYAAHRFSPWPSALFYRALMDRGGVAASRALEAHVPTGVSVRLNERYASSSADTVFDIFYPSAIEKSGRSLPTIVWVHGGGFISGDKDHVANYLKILAAKGFAVIGVNYSLAPGSEYPTPVRQVNEALAFLTANASRLHVDTSKLFLAGDSAGAQIAGQMANIISAPDYAKAIGITPSINRKQLRGMILHCGMHDPHSLNLDGPLRGFVQSVGWSYFGVKDFLQDPRTAQFSVVRNVTAALPPMFISVGNGDPLATQSRLLAETAAKLGVQVDSLFFPADYKPSLPHEYQFNLDIEAGRLALERTVAFLTERSR